MTIQNAIPASMSNPLEEDIPTPEEALGYAGIDGPITEMQLTALDLDGLSVSKQMAKQRKVVFLRAFARRGIMTDGLRAAGVSSTLVSAHWRKTDPWFEELFNLAILEAGDAVEAEAHRRAVDGYDEPVIYQGMTTTVLGEDGRERPLTVRKYSDALMQTILKGHKREKYGDKVNATLDHKGVVGVLVVPGQIDPEAWAKTAQEQQARYASSDAPRPIIEHDKGDGQ